MLSLVTNLNKNQIDSFHELIAEPDERGCMVWEGNIGSRGYGRKVFVIKGKQFHFKAHRLALFLAVPQYDESLEACHLPLICNNKLCCNPTHLRWDTHANNLADKFIDGTTGLGKPKLKCRSSATATIEKLLLEGELLQREIALKTGVAKSTVSRINMRLKKGQGHSLAMQQSTYIRNT